MNSSTVITKTNGFDRPLAPFLVRNGIRVCTWIPSHTWSDQVSISVTMEIPNGCQHLAGIEKYNDEIQKPTPGHCLPNDQFVALCRREGINVSIAVNK